MLNFVSLRSIGNVSVNVLVVVAFAFTPFRLRAQTVATFGFEDGTADGWVSFFGASTPVASNAEAYAGSYSLLTTTSATGTGGPSISLSSVLLPGAKYTITGWVRLTSGEATSSANLTVKRSDPSCSGGTCYDLIGNYKVAVTDSGWAQIGGTVRATARTATLPLPLRFRAPHGPRYKAPSASRISPGHRARCCSTSSRTARQIRSTSAMS